MIRRCLIVVAALATLAGCAYTTETSLDPKYMTVYVSPFHDESKEYDLQAPLTNAVTRKFITDSRLKVVPKEDADLLIEGVIMDYLLVITAGVRCTDQDTGDVLWEEELMAGETTYYTRAAGQSSDRLRGNAEVFLPTVRSFASEEENRAASEALEQLASDIFYRTIEPW